MKDIILNYLSVIFFSFITVFITLLVFLNAFELTFFVDIPLANSIRPLEISKKIDSQIKMFNSIHTNNTQISDDYYNSFNFIEFSSTANKINLSEGRKYKSNWYYRVDHAHIIKTKIGSTIYINKSFRTLPNPDEIVMDSDVFIGSNNDKKLSYKVTEVQKLSFEDDYIPSQYETETVVINIVDKDNQSYHVIQLKLN